MIRRPPRSTRTDTLSLHDALPISVGGRYSSERKQAENTDGIGGVLMLDASHKFNAFTPRAALRYDVTSQSSAYISYSQGFKSGLRSEEHTSELQSLMRISYAVFCLKKKNK